MSTTFSGVNSFVDGLRAALGAVTSVTRNEVQELAETTGRALSDVEETYRTLSVSRADVSFRIAECVNTRLEIMRALHGGSGINRAQSLAEPMLAFFGRMRACMAKSVDLLEAHSGQVIVLTGSTYRRANVMKHLILCDFAVEYSGRLIKRMLDLEAASYTKSGESSGSGTKAEIKWLESNKEAYLMTLRALNVDVLEYAKLVMAVPEIAVDEETLDVVRQTIPARTLDPMRMGIIPYEYNPIYYIRMLAANYDIRRYQLMKRRQDSAKLQLALLISEQKGEHNPALERQIQVYDDEIKRLAAKISEMEEEVGM